MIRRVHVRNVWSTLLLAAILCNLDALAQTPENTPVLCRIDMAGSERCPVCAMIPAQHADTAASIETDQGHIHFFCGNGCMIRAWLESEKYLGTTRTEIRKICVRNYFTGEAIDGGTAYFAGGSDVIGPMGPAFVAFPTEADREVFERRHPARFRFRLDEMTVERWRSMTTRPAPAGKE